MKMQNYDINYDVIIIGAGPAGIFTAINIDKSKRVLILEKNDAPAKKLLLAGSGRCNITNKTNINNFYNRYNDKKNFLLHQLKAFTNIDLIDFLADNAMGIVVDKNLKVFPETEKSIDVLNILLKNLKAKNCKIAYSERIIKVAQLKDEFIIETEKANYISKSLVIATGGKSYPTTGSTGEGYNYAKYFGHNIIKPNPALTPIKVLNYPFSTISGVSLDNVKISIFRNRVKIKSRSGDIGFTHTGLSGPGILDFSRNFENGDTLRINFVNLNENQFIDLFIEAVKANGKTSIKNFLKKLNLPESLILELLYLSKIDSTEQIANINKEKRKKICDAAIDFPFIIEKIGDFNVAMVTAGGVDTNEINPKTMESKIIDNLYFAGEVIDIDGDTGGYNLQFAFSSAFKAATAISLQ